MSIYVQGLNFAYDGKEVLRDIDLTIHPGERVGIIGVSGGGKSTLLKLLAGLYVPQQGSIEVAGERESRQIRRQVAMVLQSAPLFAASIRDNITCGHTIPDSAITAACAAAQLEQWLASLPQGLDTFVGERGGGVSGGQAQRIAIARAIAKDAPVVLLDEATSALDAGTGKAVLQSLERLSAGKTVVSVSHRPEALTGCHRVLRLEGGRLLDA